MTYMKDFEIIVKDQLARVEMMRSTEGFIDYSKIDQIIVGIIDGDGIGPIIVGETTRILEALLKDEISAGKIQLRIIEGLTIENRISKMETVPGDVLAAIKACHVILKGPTTTPNKSDGMPNLESANVSLRRELDLFANVRPVAIPEKNINWTFFRENTEGEYALGSRGVDINDDISIDFKVTTTAGTKRIAKAAFEFAKANGNQNVSIITKANIMKKTDGKFLELCYEVAKDYPEIKTDDWFVDIMAANLINPSRQTQYNVFILPNLYGDIITDEAAQIQGGVGTAGSSNIGGRYAMFEAIHGSAPRMLADGVAHFANPASMLKASEMLLRHIGFNKQADILARAMEITDDKMIMSGKESRNTANEYANFLLSNI